MTPVKKYDQLEGIHLHGINIDTREVFVSPVNDDGDVDWKMADQLIKNLRYLDSQSKNPILIHINTCGGDWNYGMAMYDGIKSCQSRVTTLSYAHARSMSSIFIQAADLRILTPNCDFMIHEGTFGEEGTTKQVKTSVVWNSHLTDVMLDLYVENCLEGQYFAEKGYDGPKIRRFLKNKMDKYEDWYMTANQACMYGFADGILGEGKYKTTADFI